LKNNIANKDMLFKKDKRNILEEWFRELNLKIGLYDFLLIIFITVTLTFLICIILKFSILFIFFTCVLIISLTFIFLNIRKKRNISKKEEQLEYFLISLTGNLFSQPNILNCIKKSLNEIEEPLKSDFQEVLDNYSKGLIFKDALKIMVKKSNSKLIELVLSGFIAAEEKGTDISKFINYQVEYIREKKSLKNYINILSTGPKYSSYFIMLIPIISILIITFLNKNFIDYYLSNLGMIISLYAISSFLIGFLLINKIINNLGKNILIS
jgi:Flp pilus assembly protein TadB